MSPVSIKSTYKWCVLINRENVLGKVLIKQS